MGEEISFLVIAYNSLDSTIRCLESLVKYERGAGILVLDNGSEEPIFSIVSEKFSSLDVQVFRSEKNLGVAGGRNYLLKKTLGEYLVFVDNDVELTDEVSKKIKECFRNPEVGIYGKVGIMLSDELRPFTVSEKEVDAVPGFFQAFPRKLIEEIGKLDEKFITYWNEDMDFCLRAKKAGYKIIADDSLPIIHYTSQSSTLRKKRDFIKKNQKYFYNKWRNSLKILEIEKKGINHLSCLNCSETWER